MRRVHWGEHAEEMGMVAAEHLINTLTLACGEVSLAVGGTSRNAPVSSIQARLVRAAGAFAVVSDQLDPAGGGVASDLPLPLLNASLLWRELLARLDWGTAAML